mmetsp:Transcript_105957/g.327055  ORF Transcript_105957/g.327055 Transcript_105957/m.327055 type:complete len:261 (-) Transcript_105957:554-1336(-)
MQLHDGHWPDLVAELQDPLNELAALDDARVVVVHDVEHLVEVLALKVHAQGLEDLHQLRGAGDELVARQHAVLVDVQGVEELPAAGLHGFALALAVDAVGLQARLVLLQDALVDESHQEAVDTKAAQDDEGHQEDHQRRVLEHHGAVGAEVRRRDELEEGEHGARYGAEVLRQDRGVGLVHVGVHVRAAVGPDEDHGADVQHEGRQQGHPEDRQCALHKAVGEQVELLEEAHNSDDPEDPEKPQQPHDAEDRRVLAHALR